MGPAPERAASAPSRTVAMTDTPSLDDLPEPEELVGKDELDEADEMDLDGADVVEDEEEAPAATGDGGEGVSLRCR